MTYHAPLTPEDRSLHSNFWNTVQRRNQLRMGIITLRQVVDINTGYLISEMNRRRLQRLPVPERRNIDRFLEENNLDRWRTTFRHHPEFMSHLLLLCEAICSERELEEDLNDGHIVQMRRLASELDSAMDGKLVNSPADVTVSPDDIASAEFCSPEIAEKHSNKGYSQVDLKVICDLIASSDSEDDPAYPEFPHFAPRYPATPMLEYDVEGRTIYIKDESYNPTGSHKDRWAWEMLLQYKASIQDAMRETPIRRSVAVQSLSMISNGCAAHALQKLLNEYGLPPLRVIVDKHRVSKRILGKLSVMGAKVYPYDLDADELDEHRVLEITDNVDGLDITTRSALTPDRERFFDWLVYEILSRNPKHIFVPVGTGDLFSNIVYTLANECQKERAKIPPDPRLLNNGESVEGIHVYGATTYNPRTRMDKLYAKFRPTLEELTAALDLMKQDGTIGSRSHVTEISDERAAEAERLVHGKIRTELSGIAGLGLFLDLHRNGEIPAGERVIVVNTGTMYIGRPG